MTEQRPPAPVLSEEERERLKAAAQLLCETTEGPDPHSDGLINFLRNLASREHRGEEVPKRKPFAKPQPDGGLTLGEARQHQRYLKERIEIAEEERDQAGNQERQRIQEALEKVLSRFDAGLKRGVKREYDKSLDREDRYAGHGEAEAFGRAISLLRSALDTLDPSGEKTEDFSEPGEGRSPGEGGGDSHAGAALLRPSEPEPASSVSTVESTSGTGGIGGADPNQPVRPEPGRLLDSTPKANARLAKGFEHCHRCGRGNTIWFAPSPLWNAVMRGGSIDGDPKHNDLVCATCFMALAEEAGVASHFKVFAEQVNVELETTTPSGRVWDEERQLWVDPSGEQGEEG